jgi:hypothetical protein
MKLYNSGFLGVLGAKNLGFVLALARICQPFGQLQCQEGMACPKSASQSFHNMVTSIIIAI